MIATSADFRRPPGPQEAVPLGIDPQTLETLRALRDEYGDIVSMQRPNGRLAYFVNDPVEVRKLLVKRHARYNKGPGFERVKMLLGNGLIVSDGDVWRRSRTMIQPAFSRQKVHDLTDIMLDCARTLDKRWTAAVDAGETINITEETNRFALDLIVISTFGDDAAPWVATAGNNPFEFLSRDSARDLTVVMRVREVRQLLLDLIHARRSRAREQHFDFMSMYLAARDKAGQPFSDEELLDELITLIVAGFETSANTLNWAWYLLASHPDIEQAVIEEAGQHMPNAAAVSHANASAMVYTQQVLEETLRLYPPVWLFTRRSHREDDIASFDVPVGTDIYLSPYLLHRTDRFWPDPDAFEPARFEVSDAPKKDRPYFPFSLGPRRCLGEYFSFLEMKIHLALLLPRYRMQLVDKNDPGLELGINLRSARDIMLKPTHR